MATRKGVTLDLRPPKHPREIGACARLMASSEPWITLGRGYRHSLKLLEDDAKELTLAFRGREVLGFILLDMRGPFAGYIQTLAVRPRLRGRGIGRELIAFAERRIFAERPNVFICVSSFNPRARKLYESLGYELVGELKDFVIPGRSELLLRKTIAPLARFKA